MSEPQEVKPESEHTANKPKRRRLSKRSIFVAPLLLLTLLIISAGFVYGVSPASIRKPQIEHLHFRMQVIVDGKAVDFSNAPFQMEYEKGQCSGELTTEPFHFHDNKDQFVHVHWKNMTGGELLKFYGWNFIGGVNDTLGYRMDDLPKIKKVPIHGNDLPKLPKHAKLWVYIGTKGAYQERSLDDFKKLTLEKFFNKRSKLSYEPANHNLLNWFFPTASAHAGHDHSADEAATTTSTAVVSEEERLSKLNNLIGNVVIFVQNDKPAPEQITARFDNLLPLSDSTCGG